ncbi:unnamed protein product [Effrenium voratum]|uniref:C3H1-type domain-containing protein n=1 Tax=Effrenium voratum TaxID=2562239 RepID=A0AA36I2E5_9DINO|nr:unnamed protein product [Effrenium voratum]
MAMLSYQHTFVSLKPTKRAERGSQSLPPQRRSWSPARDAREADRALSIFAQGVGRNVGLEVDREVSLHPEFCARPCLRFQAGACAWGAGCNFCHQPHAKRQKLDRHQRMALRGMTPREALQILVEQLGDRAEATELSLQLQPILEIFHEQLAETPDSRPSLSHSQGRNIASAISKMSCRMMIQALLPASRLEASRLWRVQRLLEVLKSHLAQQA